MVDNARSIGSRGPDVCKLKFRFCSAAPQMANSGAWFTRHLLPSIDGESRLASQVKRLARPSLNGNAMQGEQANCGPN